MGVQSVTMPQLGESVTEGTIEKWLVSVGDVVKKYDPIAEISSEKVTSELPSSYSGVIQELHIQEGETRSVGEVVCTIETEDVPEIKEVVVQPPAEAATSISTAHKQRYSPAVLRLASEHGIDLTTVEGTGAQGRITRKDVQKLIAQGPVQEKAATAQPVQALPKEEKTPVPTVQETATGDIEIPLTQVRKAIAKNMVRSQQEIPHAWMMIEVDVTNLVQYRDSIKEEFKKREGYNLTYFAFFVKAVAQALKEFPMLNSVWGQDKIIQKKDVNLSIAVATEEALYVPVIHHADDHSIKGIAKSIHELANKVRTNSLQASDMEGGTFTVNNTGAIGSVQSMGIINYPQAAILQVESIVKRPVIREGGMFAARDMVNLCLSVDHRILDGYISGKFLARVKEILEKTTKDNTKIY